MPNVGGASADEPSLGLEERVVRLERAMSATLDLLQQILRPRGRPEAARSGQGLMGNLPQFRGPILCVVGARPNYMKMAPLIRAFGAHPAAPGVLLVHTGQHYDVAMSDQLFADLEMPAPDINLEVGSGTHAVQTAEVMRRFEPIVDPCAAELRRRGRRRQFDAGVQSGRGEEERAGRARRGRAAQLRSLDARGDQSRADRSARRRSLHDRALGSRESAARGRCAGADSLRRQRDDRFAACEPRARRSSANGAGPQSASIHRCWTPTPGSGS